jgi:hypothetical protein
MNNGSLTAPRATPTISLWLNWTRLRSPLLTSPQLVYQRRRTNYLVKLWVTSLAGDMLPVCINLAPLLTTIHAMLTFADNFTTEVKIQQYTTIYKHHVYISSNNANLPFYLLLISLKRYMSYMSYLYNVFWFAADSNYYPDTLQEGEVYIMGHTSCKSNVPLPVLLTHMCTGGINPATICNVRVCMKIKHIFLQIFSAVAQTFPRVVKTFLQWHKPTMLNSFSWIYTIFFPGYMTCTILSSYFW